MYFWEGNERSALEWAKKKEKAGTLKEPAVIGAVIDLGRCFDLLNSSNIDTLKFYHNLSIKDYQMAGYSLPENIDHPKDTGDSVLRYLNCAIIEYMHKMLENNKIDSFDSVRAVFVEGDPIYPNAGFNDKTHIQICVINPNCIKGVFLPGKLDSRFSAI